MEKPTYLLFGASPEALGLCHALGISLAGVSDPIFGGRQTRWFDLPAYGNDLDACQKSNASSAVLAIDNSRIREQVYRSLIDAGLDFPPVSGGYLGAEPHLDCSFSVWEMFQRDASCLKVCASILAAPSCTNVSLGVS